MLSGGHRREAMTAIETSLPVARSRIGARRRPCDRYHNGPRRKDAILRSMRDRRYYSVYVMGSLSGTLHVGFSGNLHKRVFEHKFHLREGFTDKYRVERLLYWASYDDVHKAIAREKQLKGWSRKKKIALIESRNPHWVDLAREWYPWMERRGGRDASTSEARPADGPPALSMTGTRGNKS